MAAHSVTWLKMNGKTREAREWQRWFGLVPQLRTDFRNTKLVADPFFFNEIASMGLLACAATRANMLALVESVAKKRQNSRGRPLRDGRCDLWVSDLGLKRSWAFEFKQLTARPGLRPATIRAALDRACADAKCVHEQEADVSFGAVLLKPRWQEEISAVTCDRIDAAARETFFSCRFGEAGGVEQPV